MSTNRFFYLVGAAAITGFLCAWSAFADYNPGYNANAYQSLNSVSMQEAKLPRTDRGVNDLSIREARYREHLPMQLSGPLQKIKKAKYHRGE